MADKIRTLGPGTLDIGQDSDAAHFAVDATNVALEPDSKVGDSQTFLDGHEEAGALTTTYSLTGSILEDYSANGAQAYCWKHKGESLPFTFKPSNNAPLTVKGNVLVVPLQIGGDVKEKNSIKFEFTATNIDLDYGSQV